MSAYKIVGVITDKTEFCRGKVGTQANKRVYACRQDFLRYAPETIARWKKFMKLSVQAYRMVLGLGWIACELPEKGQKA